MTITETEPGFAPVQTRSERLASTSLDEFPEVTGREEEWRFSPVSDLRDLMAPGLEGGRYPSTLTEVEGVDAEWVDADDERRGRAGIPEDRAAAAAWSSTQAVLVITLRGELESDVVLTRSDLGTAPRAAHTIVHATSGSVARLILRNEGTARLTENVEFVVEDGADLTAVTVQEWDDDALHLATHVADVGRDARLRHVSLTLGGRIVRLNPAIHLTGQGARTETFGGYFADAGQHIEHQVYVEHKGPHTSGRVTYKGALQGEGARTVWIGDVLIGPDAIGTDSYEQNRNLVLSEGTRADSVPNLEIETGDIVGAGHASATGRFDDEQLFYLQSRGISEDEARRLVVRGFLLEIVQTIGSPQLEAHLEDAIEAELAGGEAVHA